MGRFKRKTSYKKPNKVIRIYTEGEKTEPNYFGSIKNELHLSEIDIRIHGLGDHTLPLVDRVINDMRNEDEDTEWWVVFDRDDHSDFDNSIKKALSYGIKVAYSNESFELWFLLHFQFLNTSIGRRNFAEKLTKHLNRKYEKNMDVYSSIKSKEQIAVKNARKLEKMHNTQRITSPIKRDPSTTVFELVLRLRKLKQNV